jgi:hypothetical protein
MEARDSGSKIRPLPIDDIDGDAPQHRPAAEPRWLPLAVIVVGAIAFAVVARGLALPEPAEVGAAATTTTSTTSTSLPAEPDPTTAALSPLSQLLPFATDSLQLVILRGWAAINEWQLDAIAPDVGRFIGEADTATYNVNGSYLAIHSGVRDGSITITDRDGIPPIYVQKNAVAGMWHPADPHLFAWTASPGSSDTDGDTSSLSIADVSGSINASLEPLIEIALEGGPHELLAWGDWGFVAAELSDEVRPTVVRYDPDGLDPVRIDGEFFDATPDGALLMARLDDSGYKPYVIEVDGRETELIGLDIGASDFRITADGIWVIALTPQADGHTSILARTVRSRSTRLTSIDEPATLVGLSSDDRHVILQEFDSADLVFKNWDTGAEHRVPIPDGDRVAAVFL